MDFRLSDKKLLYQIDKQAEDLAKKQASWHSGLCAQTRSMSVPSKDIPGSSSYNSAKQDMINIGFAIITCPLGFLIGGILALMTAVYWWHSIF